MYHGSCQPLESSEGHIPGQPQRETWDAPTLRSCWDPVLHPALHPALFLSFLGNLRNLGGDSFHHISSRTWFEPGEAEADRARGRAGCQARFGGSSRVSNCALLRRQQWGERPARQDLDPPVMEACEPPPCWHFGAAQGSSGGVPRSWQCQAVRRAFPSRAHRSPSLSTGWQCLPSATAAQSCRCRSTRPPGEQPKPPAAGSLGTQCCQGLGHGLRVQPAGTGTWGIPGRRCCWLALAPPAWHLFNITGRFWPMLHFGVALGNVPSHTPVSQRPLCCCSSPRGAVAAAAVPPMHTG